MGEPIMFVSHFRMKEGKLEAFKEHSRHASRRSEADKSRTRALLPYIDDQARKVTITHVL